MIDSITGAAQKAQQKEAKEGRRMQERALQDQKAAQERQLTLARQEQQRADSELAKREAGDAASRRAAMAGTRGRRLLAYAGSELGTAETLG